MAQESQQRPELRITISRGDDEEEDEEGEHRSDELDEEDGYSDESSSASIDPDIDFSLTYALHTFAATVPGQASVVKGDSLILLEDINSYWWLVKVLKTEDVGYIPAENIETPWERLARWNKGVNVDRAASTAEEKAGIDYKTTSQYPPRLAFRNSFHAARALSPQSDQSEDEDFGPEVPGVKRKRTVLFGQPTYVDHPGEGSDWSDEEGEEDEELGLLEGEEGDHDHPTDEEGEDEEEEFGTPLQDPMNLEPDDGMSWEDSAALQSQAQSLQDRQAVHETNYAAEMASRALRASMSSSELFDEGDGTLKEVAGAGVGGDRTMVITNPFDEDKVTDMEYTYEAENDDDDNTNMYDFPAASPPQPGSNNPFAPPTHSSSAIPRTDSPEELSSPIASSVTQQPHPILYAPQLQSQLQSSRYTPSPTSNQMRSSPSREILDPEFAGEGTKKLSATPAVARSPPGQSLSVSSSPTTATSAPSIGNIVDRPRSVSASSARSATPTDGPAGDESSSQAGNIKEKKRKSSGSGGVFSGLFKKKDRKASGGSIKASGSGGSTVESEGVERESEDDTTQSRNSASSSFDSNRRSLLSPPPGSSSPIGPAPSSHGIRMQQIDQKQQELYLQYLSQTPIKSPTEGDASLSFGTQAAKAVAHNSAQKRLSQAGLGVTGARIGRPASIILPAGVSMSPNLSTDAGGENVQQPVLSVLRIFAGNTIDSEVTFKTVLLNEATTTSELIKQSIQRFRLGNGESVSSFSLSIKGVDGEETVLSDDSQPLSVFNQINKEQQEENSRDLPTVKRSSVGSISSVASQLSMMPAITKLGDYSDDTVVKFYLNRRIATSQLEALEEQDQVPNLISTSSSARDSFQPGAITQVATGRFTLQLLIHPRDLPEGLVFDPQTEAIVPKAHLRNSVLSPSSNPNSPNIVPPSPGVSQMERKRLLVFPTNTTVAEVIEGGFDRFGIGEGVVEGGDEVEDRERSGAGTKRRSWNKRVQYGLAVIIPNEGEKMLLPSSKIMDCYATPPMIKSFDKSPTAESRRKSRDLGVPSNEHIQPSDPVFVLRRTTVARSPSLTQRRSRSSILVEDARLSMSGGTESPRGSVALSPRLSVASTIKAKSSLETIGSPTTSDVSHQQIAPTRQQIIAAQRAASRATQNAILSAQANSSQGVDIVLADRGTIRSSRLFVGQPGSGPGEEKIRYSYIEPDGGTSYDISKLVETELAADAAPEPSGTDSEMVYEGSASRALTPVGDADLLREALQSSQKKSGEDDLNDKIDRILAKVKTSTTLHPERNLTTPVDMNHTPGGAAALSSPYGDSTTSASSTPQGASSSHRNQSSISSVMSDNPLQQSRSNSRSVNETPNTDISINERATLPPVTGGMPFTEVDDIGLNHMLAIIRSRARSSTIPVTVIQPKSDTHRQLFGAKIELDKCHPLIQQHYTPLQSQIDGLDGKLDDMVVKMRKLEASRKRRKVLAQQQL